MSRALELPDFAAVRRDLPRGVRPYLEVLPGAWRSPALALIEPDSQQRRALVERARVNVAAVRGYAWIDVELPAIVLSEQYLRHGRALDLYLDLLHELTHLRQLAEGAELWDERFAYPDRPTEIEAYAVAVSEGRRLGMSEAQLFAHMSNPWMNGDEVRRLFANVEAWPARSRTALAVSSSTRA
jgi:hypothetical protein